MPQSAHGAPTRFAAHITFAGSHVVQNRALERGAVSRLNLWCIYLFSCFLPDIWIWSPWVVPDVVQPPFDCDLIRRNLSPPWPSYGGTQDMMTLFRRLVVCKHGSQNSNEDGSGKTTSGTKEYKFCPHLILLFRHHRFYVLQQSPAKSIVM